LLPRNDRIGAHEAAIPSFRGKERDVT
jgi:hypothetical protein